MTVNDLKERLKELNIQKQNAIALCNKAIADINAIDGAIQEVTYWLRKEEENARESEAKSDN